MDHWYERSFGKDYLLVYKHRDFQKAHAEVHEMIRWLALHPGAEVLDLCCGMGRHSLALADAGFHVTGVDLSDVLLDEARRLDSSRRVVWMKGDMRAVPLDKPFDAVVNLFTSFGYFSEDGENLKVLKEMHRLLKPGGQFLIDFLNPAVVRRRLVPYSERMDGEAVIKESRRIADGCVRKTIVIESPGQPERIYEEQVKLYELPDFERLLHAADLKLVQVYGDYSGREYTASESPRIIMTGIKEGPHIL